MVEITLSTSLFFLIFSGGLILWKAFASARGRPSQVAHQEAGQRGERASHSSLSLVTLGMMSFILFPLILVDVRWSEFRQEIGNTGFLYLFGFLLTGVVSYFYIVRVLRDEKP